MTQLAHPLNTAIIVGGSLVGLATAIRLAHEGLSVTVLERSPNFGEGTGLGVDRRQSRPLAVSARAWFNAVCDRRSSVRF